MNCSLGLLLGIAKKDFESGLKPLAWFEKGALLLAAELVLVVEQLQHVQDVFHLNEGVVDGGSLREQGETQLGRTCNLQIEILRLPYTNFKFKLLFKSRSHGEL